MNKQTKKNMQEKKNNQRNCEGSFKRANKHTRIMMSLVRLFSSSIALSKLSPLFALQVSKNPSEKRFPWNLSNVLFQDIK